MIEIARILCPVDFSPCSRRALDYACGFARAYGARLTVLHVVPLPVPVAAFVGAPGVGEFGTLLPTDRLALRTELQAFVHAGPIDGICVEAEVLEGQVCREITDRERAIHADLLVLGTHGRTGMGRLLLGSVAERLLRASSCPVLTVPPSAGGAAPSTLRLFRRILCPTDFSTASDAALAWAASLAQEAAADLVMLHVLENGRAHSTVADRDWCDRRLDELVPAPVRAGCTVHHVVATGVPHDVIIETSIDWRCDLIVMAVGHRRALGDRIFGSTSQHVVRSAGCPVLTTHPPYGGAT